MLSKQTIVGGTEIDFGRVGQNIADHCVHEASLFKALTRILGTSELQLAKRFV
jgi:hypothetical protein